ncbi:Alpha/Beta hydrolase protein [Colletotrichum phormii]|uniref:Alpha/Beta hydrolase protein n=1 Tax=Colletotrichum phormii TaxID=359342 RepID=A0AAI9ZYN1_9PEZI|nr:Alpha/Beta hydrolase protein [Colletotrichum phormii]KAK1640670.1 Alpha/Beta hydrolase protein [Colletotrichum phormii]
MKAEIASSVVFVHGLGGDYLETWKSKLDETVWPKDLLSQLGRFRKARIFSFDYDATAFLTPFEKETKGSTFQFAESLLDTLADSRLGPAAKTRPIVFVGHSLGGIVIKAALRHAKLLSSQFGDILSYTKAIVFFGTPHQGADAAAWAVLLGEIGSWVRLRNTEVVEELKRWSDPLVQLTRQFKEIPSLYGIHITSFYETQATASLKVSGDIVPCVLLC